MIWGQWHNPYKIAGNKPPWTLPAKAKYSSFDGPRAAKYFGTKPVKAPEFFPIMTLLVRTANGFGLSEYD
jgi:hypothetical protein